MILFGQSDEKSPKGVQFQGDSPSRLFAMLVIPDRALTVRVSTKETRMKSPKLQRNFLPTPASCYSMYERSMDARIVVQIVF